MATIILSLPNVTITHPGVGYYDGLINATVNVIKTKDIDVGEDFSAAPHDVYKVVAIIRHDETGELYSRSLGERCDLTPVSIDKTSTEFETGLVLYNDRVCPLRDVPNMMLVNALQSVTNRIVYGKAQDKRMHWDEGTLIDPTEAQSPWEQG